jgi:hypothetical protein
LPDIEDINGVSTANVNAFSGVTLSGVEDINGLTLPTPAPAVAYSVRLLGSAVGISSYTGPAMRIRRVTGVGNTGNDDEADVAFDSGVISLDSAISNTTSSASTLGEFLNVGTVSPYNGGLAFNDPDNLVNTAEAYVDTWYDQSGNANHALQLTPANQPQIHSGSSNTDLIKENGKPIIKSNDTSDGFSSIAVDMSGSTISMTSVSRSENANYNILCYLVPPVNERMMLGQNGSTITDGGQADFIATGAELFWNGSSQGNSVTRGEVFTQFYQNQTLATWVGLTDVNGTALYLSQAQSFWQMNSMQEIIFWESDRSATRTAIETDINGFFGIY